MQLVQFYRLRKQKFKLFFLFCIVSSIVFPGCSVFSDPNKPVIENKAHDWFDKKKTSVFATTASRRTVIVRFPENYICAEAPPDVAESFFNSVSLAIEKSPDIEFNKKLLVVADQLFNRTQGVQVFRDGAFHLCQAYQNGIISEQKYIELYTMLVLTTKELIVHELSTKAISANNSLEQNNSNQSIENFKNQAEEIKNLIESINEIEKSEVEDPPVEDPPVEDLSNIS